VLWERLCTVRKGCWAQSTGRGSQSWGEGEAESQKSKSVMEGEYLHGGGFTRPRTGSREKIKQNSLATPQYQDFPGIPAVKTPGQPSAYEPAPELCQTHITGDPQEDVG